MAFSDEPVLIPPTRRPVRRWIGIGAALFIIGMIAYVPWQSHQLDERAHAVARGANGGASYPVSFDGAEHTLEIFWVRGPVFAVACTPPPPEGSTLRIKGRFGSDLLQWDAEQKAFGPGTSRIDPQSHYKIELTLRDGGGAILWQGTRWAYSPVDEHGH